MLIQLREFGYMRPIVHDFNLEDAQASDCESLYLESSGLDPLPKPLKLADGFSGSKSLYRFKDKYIKADERRHYARSPVVNDRYDRLYYSDDDNGGLYQTSYSEIDGEQPAVVRASRALGVELPEPLADGWPFRVQNESIGDEDNEDADTTVFRLVYVSDRGEYSAPSYASESINYIDGQRLRFSDLPVARSRHVKTRKLYMEIEGAFYWIADIKDNLNRSFVIDDFQSGLHGEPLISQDWYPPNNNLKGLVELTNGVQAAFFNDPKTGAGTVCFSEPWQPHAWPVGYYKKIRYGIVAIVPIAGGLAVLTQGKPSIIIGSTPNVMTEEEVNLNQSCESSESAIEYYGAALYASPDGISMISGRKADVITGKMISRKQWQALAPNQMRFGIYERRLILYSGDNGWIMDFSKGGMGRLPEKAIKAFHYHGETDAFLFVKGNAMMAFARSDEHYQGKWTSKRFLIAQAGSLSAGRIEAENYPVRLIITTDDGQSFETAVLDNAVFRVQSIGRARWIKIGIKSSYRVYFILLAQRLEEIP